MRLNGRAFSYVIARDAAIVISQNTKNMVRGRRSMRDKTSDVSRELEAVLRSARAEFLEGLPLRIAQIDALLDDLAPHDTRSDDPGAALVALRSEAHRIAGLCGSIGLPELSRAGMRAEEVLRPLALGQTSPVDTAALRAAVAAVRVLREGLVRAGAQVGC
jgi:HPt (histidine-containing phosphotransfer) domain-containing protein